MRKKQWRVWLVDGFGPYMRRRYAHDLESLKSGLPKALSNYAWIEVQTPEGWKVMEGESLLKTA